MTIDTYTAVTAGPARVHEAIIALDVVAIAAGDETEALTAWAILEDARRLLAQVQAMLVNPIAEQMGDRQVVVDHVGTFVRHVKKDRTKWEKDDLLRAVLDSRLVDKETGEVVDESPLDKVVAVWNLGAPRTTALKQRQIDPDEYCHVEKGGYTIEVLS